MAGAVMPSGPTRPGPGLTRRLVTAAVIIEVLGAVGLMVGRVSSPHRAAAAPPVPTSAPVASARSQSAGPGTATGVVPPRPARGAPPPALAGPSAADRWTASGPVSCDTDLPLSASPATGYNFLCRQGGIPVTWSTNNLTVYVNLPPGQKAAFDAAVGMWATAARFRLSYTPAPQGADVTVTDASLGDGQPGFVEDGYTTVSYRCTPVCAYTRAQVELSATATLSAGDWVSTMLHELGHVAGLNHVSVPGEVMYPYLTDVPPQSYTGGDLEGLLILAAERGA